MSNPADIVLGYLKGVPRGVVGLVTIVIFFLWMGPNYLNSLDKSLHIYMVILWAIIVVAILVYIGIDSWGNYIERKNRKNLKDVSAYEELEKKLDEIRTEKIREVVSKWEGES